MTYEEWKNAVAKVEAKLDIIGDKLDLYPKGKMGMTVEHIRLSPEYRKIKGQWNVLFAHLRELNGAAPKEFLRRASDARRASWVKKSV